MEPTEEGKKRYPHTGGYWEELPCTCTNQCPDPCRGSADHKGCQCEACTFSYYEAIEYG